MHWAAKFGNIVLLNRMIECGATAPYHRMVQKAAAKRAEEEAKSKVAGFAQTGDLKGVDGLDGLGGGGEVLVVTAAADGEGVTEKGDAAGGASGGTEDAAATAAAATMAAAEAAAAAIEDQMAGEDDDEDDEWAMERRLETSVDLTKNTPLLWACVKGNMAAVWCLLVDGYSPNDLDNMGNNALHLAAAAGSRKVVKALIDDGVVSTLVNVYKNCPIDLATDREVRDMIAEAMQKDASMTAADMEAKHDANMKSYARMTSSLSLAVAKAQEVLDGFERGSRSPRAPGSGATEVVRVLADAIRVSREWSLDADTIAAGDRCIALLELGAELVADIAAAEKESPFRTQSQYIQHIHKIEATLARAEALGVTPKIISHGRELVHRAQIEYWVSTLAARLGGIDCAHDCHEYDMNKLKQAIVKAQVQRASDEIVQEAVTLHRRLESELGMSRALLSFPTYKLPYTGADGAPEGYYTEADVGHVRETPEYPNPPEGGEYIWDPAENFAALQACVARLKEAFTGADAVGANPAVVLEAKTRLLKAEKDLKLLTVKEEADKAAGIEAAQKKCKKKPAAKAKK